MTKTVVLFSGGLDSTLVCHLLKVEGHLVFPLFINYGQLNHEIEHKTCQDVSNRYGFGAVETLDIKDYGRLIPSGLTDLHHDIVKDAFLAGRNALFLLCASAFAYTNEISNIAIGLLDSKNSIFPDQTPEFINCMQNLIQIAIKKDLRIITPLASFNKQDVIKLAKGEGITGTYSCHTGNPAPCGKCIACLEFKGG